MISRACSSHGRPKNSVGRVVLLRRWSVSSSTDAGSAPGLRRRWPCSATSRGGTTSGAGTRLSATSRRRALSASTLRTLLASVRRKKNDAPGCPRLDDRDSGRPPGTPRFGSSRVRRTRFTLLRCALGAGEALDSIGERQLQQNLNDSPVHRIGVALPRTARCKERGPRPGPPSPDVTKSPQRLELLRRELDGTSTSRSWGPVPRAAERPRGRVGRRGSSAVDGEPHGPAQVRRDGFRRGVLPRAAVRLGR
jgi:hypothetical protein